MITLETEWERLASQVLDEFADDEFERRLARLAFFRGALAALAVTNDRGAKIEPRATLWEIAAEIEAESKRRRAAAKEGSASS